MSDTDGLLAIGELARRTGTPTSALRYYERIGLLPAAERAGGRRRYHPTSAGRLAFIRLCQDAGFTLGEIRLLLGASSRRRPSWNHLAERKLAELDARIADAQQAKKLLGHASILPQSRSPRMPPVPRRGRRPPGFRLGAGSLSFAPKHPPRPRRCFLP